VRTSRVESLKLVEEKAERKKERKKERRTG
jgi:hypothetical protein